MRDGQPDIIRFMVVGAFRSGTTYVMHSLRDHPDVAMARLELTPSPLFTIGLGAFTDFQGDFDLKRDFVRSAFDSICCLRDDTGARARGAKTALRDELDARDVVTGLREFLNDYVVILVQRRDLVAQYVSLYLAHLTGRWHVSRDQPVPVPDPTHLDPTPFRRYLREARQVEACLGLLTPSPRTCVVDYDRHIAGAEGIDHVFEALQLAPPTSPPSLGRTTAPLEQWIENLPELRELERAAVAQDPAAAEEELQAHRKRVLRNENVFFQLGRARFLLQEGRFHEAQEQAMLGLRRGRGAVNRHEARAFIVLARSFGQLGDAALARRSLDELRPRFGDCAEFLEAEAELALSEDDRAGAMGLIERARTCDPDFSTVQRLDQLEQRARS